MPKNNEAGSAYACDCGQTYMSEETLQQHQQNNCKNRSVFSCSFCQGNLSSLAALREHLLLCGNKTDECPNCRRLIRRSHFAYHYENNCASIDEVETPPTERQSRLAQRPLINSNTPIARVDIPIDNDRENYPGQNPSMHPQRVNDRIQSNLRDSPVTVQCEYCRRRCAQSDYKTHKDNCIRNPANNNNRQLPRKILSPNQNQGGSNDVVRIPCEICDEPIDIRNWSNHTQTCREQELHQQRIRDRSMSKEPVSGQLPCDYCQQLYKAKQLNAHQKKCSRNPNNMKSPGRHPGTHSTPSLVSPNQQKRDGRHLAPSDFRSPNNHRNVHYQSIDVDLTHAANKSPDNNKFNNHGNRNQHLVRRAASDEVLIEPGNIPMRLNRDRSYENVAQPHRYGPLNGIPQRGKPSSDNLRDIKQNPGARNDIVDNHSSYRKHGHPVRGTSGSYEVINNHPDHPLIKKRKQSWWKEFFGCGMNGVYD